MKSKNNLQQIHQIMGRKWNILIIGTLSGNKMRFKDLKTEISDISDRVLSQRLLEMERMNIIKRYVYTGMPVKIEYGLTIKGQALEKIFSELITWEKTYF